MFDLYQPNSLQKKISSQRTVLENLGSPTIAITIDNKQHFMYLSEDVRHLLFFKPKVIERNILLINFDDNNYIADISSYNLANENSDFKFSSQTTAIKRKNNLVDHFINNTSKLGS
jgi:outer membrane protein assembly factor BamE (lipoprotein component of BamABCDE complex)